MQREGRADVCAELLRHGDRERFLLCQLASPARRGSLYALYAFHLEIAKTREMVHEPLLGQIRLQWWREALQAAARGDCGEGIVAQLAAACARHDLPYDELQRLIDARSADLEPGPFEDLAGFEHYCQESAVPLMQLALRITLGPAAGNFAAMAWSVAMAQAMAGLVTALPRRAALGRVDLPLGVSAQQLCDRRGAAGLQELAARVGQRAQALLDGVRLAAVPRFGRAPLLSGAIARYRLRRLARAGWDPFALELVRPDPWLAGRLMWAQARGRV